MNKFNDWYQGAASINPSYIALYDMWQGPRSNHPKMPTLNTRTTSLSKKSRLRIQRTINILIDSSKLKSIYNKETKKYFRFRVNLITLTLPSTQNHPDIDIHNKIFKPFIRAIKQKFTNFLYIYKAEVQDNGNLHYHLTTNTYIDYLKLRHMWNYYCNKLNYIDKCSVKSPNSTDVHSVKNIDNLAAYLSAYLSKKDLYTKKLKRYFRRYGKRIKTLATDVFHLPRNYFAYIKRKINIKLWDCSKSLLLPPLRISEGDTNYSNIINYVTRLQSDTFSCDRCMVIKLTRKTINGNASLSSIYNNWIKQVYR